MSTYFYLVRRKILFLVKHFLLLRGTMDAKLVIPQHATRYASEPLKTRVRSSRLEWLYGLHSAKICAVHNAQSGLPSCAKNLCAVVALLAAQPVHLNIYVNPRMRTTSLCVMRLPICEFFCLTPRMHTGTPCMHTGTSF